MCKHSLLIPADPERGDLIFSILSDMAFLADYATDTSEEEGLRESGRPTTSVALEDGSGVSSLLSAPCSLQII